MRCTTCRSVMTLYAFSKKYDKTGSETTYYKCPQCGTKRSREGDKK